ncbi:MAG: hypothetical protein AAGH64_03960 [Planctomycetota bacterium]
MSGTLFPDDRPADSDHRALCAQYVRCGRTLDDLPYTDELAELCAHLGRSGDERGVLDELLRIRKRGDLPKTGAKAPGRTTIDAEHLPVLTRMVEEAAGSMGKRDRLPHTPEFDGLLARFNAECGLAMSAHDLWRVVARLAK